MSEPVSPSLQYDDLRGRLAIDGHEHVATMDLPRKGVPKGFHPVGLKIFYANRDGGDQEYFSVSILAMDGDLLYVRNGDGVRQYADQHGSIPVHQFDTELLVADLMPLVKRLSIVLQDDCTNDVPLKLIEVDD